MKGFLVIGLLLIFSYSIAEFDAYRIPITRNNETKTRLTFNSWAGEYPYPVINVNSHIKDGYTEIFGYPSLRQLDKKQSCFIKNGLYNPWSKTKNSVINYYSLVPVLDYQVEKTVTIDDQKLHPNTKITNVFYLSEGYCDGSVKLIDNKIKHLTFMCDDVDNASFKRLNAEDDFYEQWLYVNCKNGHKVFIRDKTLLKVKGVTKGDFNGYGEVTAKSPQ